ncbi:DNA mismatch repair endonuclease MutL [uncultured Trichococcus sp.]|uniref:DNA mismatch repair endonuclease MutL n=1 Tax=uncultured Trichococcus sp. TaxID=189665 RepID=UPI002A18B8B6|nr:DNA mismatch repair endonuclease MutL [uncultured Trichococcus sp.]
MAKIRELSQILTNQIAAGEVIERPASVVKELVENAIDANSTQIDVFIEEAGLKKVQVTDNGDGIAADEVKLAFTRHATSKIYTQDDLFRIHSLGFRGEALPSIASVAKVSIETAVADQSGTYLSIKGGVIGEERPNKSRKGTTIIVEDLFYNTPARLKYIRSLQTELSNITDIMNRIALSHPEIAFRLHHEGNQLLHTAGNGDLRQTIAGVYGTLTAKKMKLIENENLDFKLKGYISLPDTTRASRNYITLILNGRFIKNYALNKAIIDGYGSKLMVGRYPLAVIVMDADSLLLDVNVHPSKKEVRISKEKELGELIQSAVAAVLRTEERIPSGIESLKFKRQSPVEPVRTEQLSVSFRSFDQELVQETEANLPATNAQEDFRSLETSWNNGPVYEESEERPPVYTDTAEGVPSEAFSTSEMEGETNIVPSGNQPKQDRNEPSALYLSGEPKNPVAHEEPIMKTVQKIEAETEKGPASKRPFPDLHFFGQMHGTYLFAQNETGLYIIDQHAAQERIKYEYYREEIGKVSTDLQGLLIPIILDYPANEFHLIQESREVLEEMGLFLEPFGQNSFIVEKHPAWFTPGEEEEILKELVEMFLTEGDISIKKLREATAIMMSCKRSIKANHFLSDKEARQLLIDLAETENPYNCPHGRPVLIQFSNQDMEKMFKRIQDPH